MTTTVQLSTCNYQAFRAGMGVPVQASNGKPRYPVPYDLEYAVKEVYPPWAIVRDHGISHADFRTKYRASLDATGVGPITSRLTAIALATAEPRLVLLCFEDLSKGEHNWCHRTMFAEWWTEQTGHTVTELGPRPEPPEAMLF